MPRVMIECAGIEFEENGNTVWIHGAHGTILRIKCSGRITVKSCQAPGPHADIQVNGDIEFCLPDNEKETA